MHNNQSDLLVVEMHWISWVDVLSVRMDLVTRWKAFVMTFFVMTSVWQRHLCLTKELTLSQVLHKGKCYSLLSLCSHPPSSVSLSCNSVLLNLLWSPYKPKWNKQWFFACKFNTVLNYKKDISFYYQKKISTIF